MPSPTCDGDEAGHVPTGDTVKRIVYGGLLAPDEDVSDIIEWIVNAAAATTPVCEETRSPGLFRWAQLLSWGYSADRLRAIFPKEWTF